MEISKKHMATGTAAFAILAAILLGVAAYSGMLRQDHARGLAELPTGQQAPAQWDFDNIINMGE